MSDDPDVVLSARGVTKRYRRGRSHEAGPEVLALDHVSLETRRGEILAVLGPSGSGKSTLARCVAFLERPDEGEVRLEGRAAGVEGRKDLRAARRRVQLVFQDPARSVHPRMTVRQVLEEPIRLGIPLGEDPDVSVARLGRLLAEVDLPESILGVRARSLSGGQLQRLVLARALTTDPEVLVLDESLSGLDLSLQAKLANLLLDLVDRRGLSCVLISHDPALAGQLADRSVRLRAGRLEAVRSAEEPA